MMLPTISAVAAPSPRVPRGSCSWTGDGPAGGADAVLMERLRVSSTAAPFQRSGPGRSSSPVDESPRSVTAPRSCAADEAFTEPGREAGPGCWSTRPGRRSAHGRHPGDVGGSPRSARSIPHRTGRLVAVTGPSSGLALRDVRGGRPLLGRGSTMRVHRGSPYPLGATWTDGGSTSRSSPRWPNRSTCACSTTRRARRSRSGSPCPRRRGACGTATSPTCVPASSTACGCPGPTARPRGRDATRTSSCSTPTPRRSAAMCATTTHCSATASGRATRT